MTTSSSSSFSAPRRLRAALALTGAALALLALAGCAPEDGAGPTASPSAGGAATTEPAATATATAEPTESATPAPAAAGSAVGMTCDQVLTDDDIYALNPNYGVDPAFAATSDTAVSATSYNGIACGWLNQSSNAIVEVSVAMPNETLANNLKDAALAGGDIVPTYGSAPDVEGYFSSSTGTAQVFTRGYWVAVTSPDMTEPGDAERIMSTVLDNL